MNNSDFTGVGGFGQYDFGGFKLTANAASDKSDAFGLIGGFGPANLGFIRGKTDGQPNTTTIYGSYSLPLFDVKGASITPAFSTSKSGSTKANGVRVRANYTF